MLFIFKKNFLIMKLKCRKYHKVRVKLQTNNNVVGRVGRTDDSLVHYLRSIIIPGELPVSA